VADDASGLQVVDISDPTNLTLVGNYDTPGFAYGVAVSGDHAFVADTGSGLQVIDISYFMNPTLLGNCDTPGGALGVAVSGDHAFVADYDYGLQVIDISDPANPALVGSCYPPGVACGIAISGDYAFMANGNSGLQVIDISDPTNPMPLGSYDTPGTAFGVALSGDYAFVADCSFGLQVIDISDPTDPKLLGNCDTPGDAWDIDVSGDHAFVPVAGSHGLHVVDISDPTDPKLLGNCDTWDNPFAVAVSGDHAFVAIVGSGLQVIDISDPTDPTLVGSCNTPGYLPLHVAISGDYAFMADDDYGLQVIDIADPTDPKLLGNCDTPGSAIGVAVSGDHAFVADAGSGLQVIQVFQSEVDTVGNVGWSLALDGSNDTILWARLTVTQTDSVSWELSADDGASWQGVALSAGWNKFAVPGADLLWHSTHRWMALGDNPSVSCLEIDWLYQFPIIETITDVRNDQGRQVSIEWTRSGNDFVEASPQVTEYAIFRRIDPLALSSGMTDVASAASRMAAAADPELATALAAGWHYVTTVPADAVDEYAVVVPTLADSTIAEGQYWSTFMVRARTATPGVYYESYPDSGYSVDNLEPNVPEGFAIAYNAGSGNELTWDESEDADFRYFCIYRGASADFTPSGENRVDMTTATEWTDPEYNGWEVYYKITAVDFSGNESDPASPEEVTAVTEPVIPKAYGLYPNVPNPFNPITTISFDVPAGGGAVTLRIYDVSGRLVRTLVDGYQTAGQKQAIWNGTDNQGRGVVSGVYFYRLEAPGYKKTLKMVLIQ
jgi:hypothetical protein